MLNWLCFKCIENDFSVILLFPLFTLISWPLICLMGLVNLWRLSVELVLITCPPLNFPSDLHVYNVPDFLVHSPLLNAEPWVLPGNLVCTLFQRRFCLELKKQHQFSCLMIWSFWTIRIYLYIQILCYLLYSQITLRLRSSGDYMNLAKQCVYACLCVCIWVYKSGG